MGWIPVRPMEPVSRSRPFDDERYAYQLKWDGVRMLAHVVEGAYRVYNRKLRERTGRYPEMSILTRAVRAKEAVLDGEMVVLDHEARPSFPRVLERDLSGNPAAARRLAALMPATYVVFDLIYVDGRDISRESWAARQEMLKCLLVEERGLHLAVNFEEGVRLFQAAMTQGIEGIVAKLKTSPYVAGRKSEYWIKVKCTRRAPCVVGGVRVRGDAVRSLLLGLYRGNVMVYVGKAGSGLSEKELVQLKDYVRLRRRPDPPFVNPPAYPDAVWTHPDLVAVVEYAEWTEGLKLRAPRIAGWSTASPQECRI